MDKTTCVLAMLSSVAHAGALVNRCWIQQIHCCEVLPLDLNCAVMAAASRLSNKTEFPRCRRQSGCRVSPAFKVFLLLPCGWSAPRQLELCLFLSFTVCWMLALGRLGDQQASDRSIDSNFPPERRDADRRRWSWNDQQTSRARLQPPSLSSAASRKRRTRMMTGRAWLFTILLWGPISAPCLSRISVEPGQLDRSLRDHARADSSALVQ